jgi:lipopolysaccharide/colanic/teichoic acid biosynthesis glycosyltransferase
LLPVTPRGNAKSKLKAHFLFAPGLTSPGAAMDDWFKTPQQKPLPAPSPIGAVPVAMRFNTSAGGANAAIVGDLVLLHRAPNPLTPVQRFVKRFVDVTGALWLLVFAAPTMLLAALLIRLTSRGPAIYSQTRVGADGREFSLYKLRTMVAGAEERTGPVMATAGDPRITRIGGILRATHLDELPQLFNVLLGEMSLIGPRPERPHFVRIYRRQFPGYDFRLKIKPGISGLAQTRCRYSTTPALKLRFDLRYLYHYSLRLDAQIAVRTVFTILQPSRTEGIVGATGAQPVGIDVPGSDD